MMKKCSAPGCDLKATTKGYCGKHYMRAKRGQPHDLVRMTPWTLAEDEQLLACEITPWTERYRRGEGSLAKVAKELGRTEQACRDRLHEIQGCVGLRTDEGLWTSAEDEIIRQHIGNPTPPNTWPAVAEHLGRTVGAVRTRACTLRKTMTI